MIMMTTAGDKPWPCGSSGDVHLRKFVAQQKENFTIFRIGRSVFTLHPQSPNLRIVRAGVRFYVLDVPKDFRKLER